jgi:serine protease SohB
MGEFSTEILTFFVKAVIVVGVILASGLGLSIVALVISSGRRRSEQDLDLEISDLVEVHQATRHALLAGVLSKRALKTLIKTEPQMKQTDDAPRTFVVSFTGSRQAQSLRALRREISGLLAIARPGLDEVAIRLESPGGSVVQYGHAAAQLARIREAGVQLTALVDEVAASGGYLMAAVAHRIVAAPFAAIGSIGVLVQIPNVARWLKEHQVDVVERTAGVHKRTVSVLGEIKPEGLTKLDEQLKDTHDLFQVAVLRYRPQLQMEKVSTGEYWYGSQAIGLGLIDALGTSDAYIDQQRTAGRRVFHVRCRQRENWYQRIGAGVAKLLLAFRQDVEASDRQFKADLRSPTGLLD